jgi:zinc protease
MKRALATLIVQVSCIALAPGAAIAQPPATPAPHAAAPDTPLPVDPRLVTGTLDNGLHYIVVKHPRPEGRTTMWLHVNSGSMNEKESQRGLAHYLEHMAFNGSQHFPPGSLVKYFESIGLRFGGDLNAFTNTDQTTFQLNLPGTDDDTVSKGLTFLSDVAFRLSLLPDEIDAERQIILNEKMSRSGAGQRINDYVSQRIAPGSLVGERITIGTEERIKGAQKPDFVDYYSHWYVPSNITVIVVADAAPAPIVKLIEKWFADGPKAPLPAPQDPRITPYTQTRAIIATDPELENANIQVVRLLPGIPATTTERLWRDELVTSIATSAFNRRMQAKLSAGGQPFLSAGASAGSFHHDLSYETQVRCSGKPAQWHAMLDALGAEAQRARLHGFSAREIDAIRTQRLSSAEEAVRRESSVPAATLIRQIDSSITAAEPFMSAKQDLDLLNRYLSSITREEVSARFASLFEPKNVAFILELPSSQKAPSEAELIAMGNAAMSVTPEADPESALATSLLDKLPEAGTIVEPAEHAASHVWSGWLSNGIRLHERTMDEQKDEVSIVITFVAGALQETDKNRGITLAAEQAWSHPATSKLSNTDIRDLMNAKKVRVGGAGGPAGRGGGRGQRGGGGGGALDNVTLRITGTPEDLESGMQLAYLLLTDPVIEQASFDQWKSRELQSIEGRDKSPQGAFTSLEAAALHPGHDARFLPLTAAQITSISRDSAQAWLKHIIATAPVEVSIVGDIPRERALELVSRYLGSLPSRPRVDSGALADLRRTPRPKGPISMERTIETSTDQAIVRVGFFGPDADNIPDVRAMQLAANILSTRMVKTIREERNLVYSISAASQPGRTLPGFGIFSAGAPAEPGNATPLAATINEMLAEFAAKGPTDDEVVVAKKQMANALAEQMKTSAFWLAATTAMDYRNAKLDDAIAAPQQFQSVTPKQIKDTFAKYFKDESRFTLTIRPAHASEHPSSTSKPAAMDQEH